MQIEHPLIAGPIFVGPVSPDLIGAGNAPVGRTINLAAALIAEMLHCRRKGDHLEYRAGGIALLGSPVQQRPLLLIVDRRHVSFAETLDEYIRIECRMADHGHDRPALRVDDYRAAAD